jgi:hypothetical protein
MNAHHAGTTGEATTAKNRSQPRTFLIETLASAVASAPARRRHAPGGGHTVGAVAMVAAGLLLGALAGLLIGLAASILLAGPDATRLLVLGGVGEGALAGVVIGSCAAVRASSYDAPPVNGQALQSSQSVVAHRSLLSQAD